MAILYVFTINNPSVGTVEDFPPSVMNSDWLKNLQTYLSFHAVGGEAYGQIMIVFANQTELQNYITTYKLTDPTLISDLNTWKSTYNISYTSAYYNLTDAGITPTPDPIVP